MERTRAQSLSCFCTSAVLPDTIAEQVAEGFGDGGWGRIAGQRIRDEAQEIQNFYCQGVSNTKRAVATEEGGVGEDEQQVVSFLFCFLHSVLRFLCQLFRSQKGSTC